MPRIKTKGEAICFRLPVHLWDVLVELSAEANIPPQQWAHDHLVDILQATVRSPDVSAKVGADDQSAAARMLDGII